MLIASQKKTVVPSVEATFSVFTEHLEALDSAPDAIYNSG